MPLVCTPPITYRCKEGAFVPIAFMLRDATDSPLFQVDSTHGVNTWDFRVYDENSATPETALYSSLNRTNSATDANQASTPVIILTAVTVNGFSPTAAGHTFLEIINPVALWSARSGCTYTLEWLFRLTALTYGSQRIVHRAPLVIEPAYL